MYSHNMNKKPTIFLTKQNARSSLSVSVALTESKVGAIYSAMVEKLCNFEGEVVSMLKTRKPATNIGGAGSY